MTIQEIYDNLTPAERHAFANNIASRIKEEDYFANLSGYSKEELLQELSGRDLYDIISGALYAGVKMEDIRNWMEREIMD